MPPRFLRLVNMEKVGTVTYSLPDAWESALEEWLTWLKLGGVSPGTARVRREHVRPIARRSGTEHPRQLTLSLLIKLTNLDWSNEYRRGVRRSLISFCEWAVNNDLMDQNPALQLPTVPGSKPHPQPVPTDIWQDLMDAAPPREQMMVRLAAEAGLRRAEIAQARRNDLVHDAGGWSLIVIGKGDKQRVVPITEDLARAIREFRVHGYLFPGNENGHISAKWVGTLISNLMPPGWTIHKLRHRYASRGYAKTRDIFAVKDALGHESIATTQLYVAIARDNVRQVSEGAAPSPDDVA